MKNAILTVATACLIAAPVFAQAPKANSNEKANRKENRATAESRAESRLERRVSYLTTVLSLTNSQQDQAKKIFADAANENAAIRKNLQTEREDLRKAVNTSQPSTAIAKAANAMGSDIGQIVSHEANTFQQFRKILTPEQQTKLGQLERETHGWHMGFFGPGAFTA